MSDLPHRLIEPLPEDSLKKLLDDIATGAVQKLTFGEYRILDRAADRIAAVLKKDQNIHMLYFDRDAIGDKGLKTIAHAVAQSGNRNMLIFLPYMPEVDILCRKNMESAHRLSLTMRDHPMKLTYSDLQEIPSRIQAIVHMFKKRTSGVQGTDVMPNPSKTLEGILRWEADPHKRFQIATHFDVEEKYASDTILERLQEVAVERKLYSPKSLDRKELERMAQAQKSEYVVEGPEASKAKRGKRSDTDSGKNWDRI